MQLSDAAQTYLVRGKQDLEDAEAVAGLTNVSLHAVGFLLQQACEKALKAYLVQHKPDVADNITKTHSIYYLTNSIRRSGLPLPTGIDIELLEDVLSYFGVGARYELIIPPKFRFDRAHMTTQVRTLVDWIVASLTA